MRTMIGSRVGDWRKDVHHHHRRWWWADHADDGLLSRLLLVILVLLLHSCQWHIVSDCSGGGEQCGRTVLATADAVDALK